MIKKLILATTISVGLSAMAYAKGDTPVSVMTASYQKVVVKDKKGKIKRDKNGKPIYKWVRAAKVVPNDIIKYVNTITNDSNETLKDARVANPINKHLEFVGGSAKLAGVRPADDNAKALSSEVRPLVTVKYSVDGGKNYDDPANLFIKDKKGKKIQAQAKHYNGIEFVISEVPAHSKVDIEFKVKLK